MGNYQRNYIRFLQELVKLWVFIPIYIYKYWHVFFQMVQYFSYLLTISYNKEFNPGITYAFLGGRNLKVAKLNSLHL